MTEVKLRECPFCNGEAFISSKEYQIYCNTCGAMSGYYHSDKEAVIAWNKRTDNKYTPSLSIENKWDREGYGGGGSTDNTNKG